MAERSRSGGLVGLTHLPTCDQSAVVEVGAQSNVARLVVDGLESCGGHVLLRLVLGRGASRQGVGVGSVAHKSWKVLLHHGDGVGDVDVGGTRDCQSTAWQAAIAVLHSS